MDEAHEVTTADLGRFLSAARKFNVVSVLNYEALMRVTDGARAAWRTRCSIV